MTAEDPQAVHFTVTDRFVNVHMLGGSVCQFGVAPDGTVIIAFPSTFKLDQVELHEGSIATRELKAIAVEVLHQEIDEDMAIPRYHRTKITPAALTPAPPRVIRVTVDGERVNPRDVEELVDAIVMSFVAEPTQTKARTAEITKELSKRFGIPIMSIAGVRAALTRGAYGSLADMIKAASKRARNA